MAQAGATWVRRNAVVWSQVEPTEGARNWQALAGLENELAGAGKRGLQVILIVRGTPSWAQAVAGKACGPIRPDKLTAFGAFMRDLAVRYSAAPYGVRYWEMWNEPDVDAALVPGESVFGCWGNKDDPYYGGGNYAEMLKVAYAQIKAADPQGQVLVGGLLLDCNPALTDRCPNGRPAMFLEGILRAGGGDSFDGVAFHAYDYYGLGGAAYANPGWNTSAKTTGPVLAAKADFLQQTLAAHGVSGKYLMNTESALLCVSCANDPAFESAKAWYVPQVYATALANGLRANVWYSALGWRNSGLLAPDLTSRPAYAAYRTAAAHMGGAVYEGALAAQDLGGASGVVGHKLRRNDDQLWLLWSADGAVHQVTLARTPAAVVDAVGATVAIGPTLAVGQKPLYVIWGPSGRLP